MGLDSSPACCTSLLLTSSFSTILFLYLPLLVHLCAQIFSISYCYPTPSFFPALTFFPLFLFIAPLFYNFLPRLYFCHFLSLFSPISTTCLSFSSSLFLFLIDLTSLSLSLSIFSHDHPNYFKFSVIPTSVISQDWHLVTDDSMLPCCDVPGSIR